MKTKHQVNIFSTPVKSLEHNFFGNFILDPADSLEQAVSCNSRNNLEPKDRLTVHIILKK